MYWVLSIFFTSVIFLYKSLRNSTLPRRKSHKSSRAIKKGKSVVLEDSPGLKKEIRFQGKLYDVTDFIGRHPGGNIIQFYVNNDEDATNAILQFHHRVGAKVELMLKGFKSRPDTKNGKMKEDVRYGKMSADFEKLYRDLVAEGYFKGSGLHVILRLLDLTFLASLGMFLALSGETFYFRSVGVLFMGMFFGRCGWVMHEGGHYSLTGRPTLDRFIQILVMGFGDGMSASWWRSQHNRHHAMPQRLKHDVDLNTVPFFATSLKIFEEKKQANNFVLRHQSLFFVPLGSVLVFLNWKFNLHPRYAWRKGQYLELFMMAAHYLVLEYPLGIWFTFLAYLVGAAKMILNFALSHSHRPVTEEPRHWLEYALSHTVNIHPSWLCDWWMGYLNYQIEHHLFPTMPQFRQREISPRVKALAEKHGLMYECISYRQAVRLTYKNLMDISQEIAFGGHI